MATAAPDSDRDWLYPSDCPPSERPMLASPFAGVLRIDACGEEPVQCSSLYAATRERPATPEAEVRGKGGCLAQASRLDSNRIEWLFTNIGAERLYREIHGEREPATEAAAIKGARKAVSVLREYAAKRSA